LFMRVGGYWITDEDFVTTNQSTSVNIKRKVISQKLLHFFCCDNT
jgi:hypothetical protein